MGLRFRKSITICKGVKLNIGKKGASVSLGKRGLHYTIHSSGRRTVTAGIPGTGLFYTKSINPKVSKATNNKRVSTTNKEQEALLKQQEREAQLAENKRIIQEYEEYLKLVRSLHQECNEPYKWRKVVENKSPLDAKGIGENERIADQNYRAFQETFAYKYMLFLNKSKIASLEADIERAKVADQANYESWKSIHDFAFSIVNGNTESYCEAIKSSKVFYDLADFGSEFEFGTDSSDTMHVDFTINSVDIIPKERITLTPAGNLSIKEYTKSEFYDLYQDYVCSCSIRLAREIFALLPVKRVVINVTEDSSFDICEKKHVILAVIFVREIFNETNFKTIDPSDFIEQFKSQMDFKKTKGFSTVERIDD